MNVLSTILKFFRFKDESAKVFMGVFNEVADKGIPLYLSRRRELLGIKFRVDNPELFNEDHSPKIISDKLFSEAPVKEFALI